MRTYFYIETTTDGKKIGYYYDGDSNTTEAQSEELE